MKIEETVIMAGKLATRFSFLCSWFLSLKSNMVLLEAILLQDTPQCVLSTHPGRGAHEGQAHLPQQGENNIPQAMDVVGELFL